MDLAWTTDFITGIAANCAHSFLRLGITSLRAAHLSDDECKAVTRAYQHAFEAVLHFANDKINLELAAHTQELFECFAEDPQVAGPLLDLAISDEMPPLELLRERFRNAGFDPSTFPIDFDGVVERFICALQEGLQKEAASPGSPLFNKVCLARITELRNQLRESQRKFEIVIALFSQQEGRKEDDRESALSDYVDAMHAYCNQFTYLSMLSRPLPSFSAVYVPQAWEDLVPRPNEKCLIEPTEALERAHNLVLIGGSGGGKSSAALGVSLALLDHWRTSAERRLLPIIVSARGLVHRSGSISECLHELVSQELGRFLKRGLPSKFFECPPAPEALWFVIVDGLDEIVGHDLCERLIIEIQQHWCPGSSCYRFMLTSRPSSSTHKLQSRLAKELKDELAQKAGTKECTAAKRCFGLYAVSPFSTHQIHTLAYRWFNALPESSANDATKFLSLIAQSRIRELSRIPLLVTMAAIVYSENRATTLPQYRAGLYESFVSTVVFGEESKRGTLQSFCREWIERYGTSGGVYAEALFTKRLQLLEYLAKWYHLGGRKPFPDEGLSYAVSQGWLQADDLKWQRDELETVLQRTGLLAWHDRTLSFIHQSFQEYLTAKWYSRRYNPVRLKRLPFKIADPHWREVFIFLLTIWSAQGLDVTRPTKRALASGGLPLASTVLAEGVCVESSVDDAIVKRLIKFARMASNSERARRELFDPVRTLQRLASGREEALLGLRKIAMDQAALPEWRVKAGFALIVVSRPDLAREALLSLYRDSVQDRDLRWAMRSQLYDPDQNERVIWMALAHDEECSSLVRLDAAISLATSYRRFDELLAFTSDSNMSSVMRMQAASALTEYAGPCEQTTQGWLSLARYVGLGASEVRIEAVRALEWLGQFDALKSLAVDPDCHIETRIEAMRVLGTRLAEASCALLSFAKNDSLEMWLRVRAVFTLIELNCVEELICLVNDPGESTQLRRHSARGLGSLHAAKHLLPVSSDASIDRDVRIAAAMSILCDESVPMLDRESVLLVLRSIGDEVTAAALQSVKPFLECTQLQLATEAAIMQIRRRVESAATNYDERL